jgi:hypothetical protein
MKKLNEKIIMKLFSLLFPNSHSEKYLIPYFKIVKNLIDNQGIIHTTKYLKQCRLHCTRYICGNALYSNNLKIGIDPDGWPKAFSFLKELSTGNLEQKKLMFSILTITRSFILNNKEKDKLKPDYKSITEPGRINKIIPTGFIIKFVKRNKILSDRPKFDKKNIYISNKAGPIGKTTKSAMKTLFSYSYDLMASIFKITDQSGIDYFSQSYKFNWDKGKNLKPEILGKLSFIYDPECKLRIVAIMDYYTQLFLKPIHMRIMHLLSNFPCDRTYTQDPFHKWKDDNENFWSLDLSSATDRFPIDLQRRLLSQVFDKELSDGWKEILSGREFMSPNGKLLKYSVGQPMGAYSSWAAFTLTHHLVVHWCAHLCGYDKFTDYILLGDDIVIKNDKVALMYKKWMNHLGVDLSDSKTHVSKDTYEFAKRWIYKGREITGLPLNGIINNINNPFIVMVTLYDFYKVKGNFLSSFKNLNQIVSSLYKGLNKKLSTKYDNSRFRLKMKVFHKSLDFAFGYSTIDSLREMLALNISNESFVIPGNDLIHQVFDDVISQGLCGTVEKSMKELALLGQKLIYNCEVIDIDDHNDLRFHPLFQGVNNYINNYKEQLSNWSVNSLNYRQKSKELLMLNIDHVFDKERNRTLELINTGKIFNLGFKKINSMDEIMYGSSVGESTYSYSKDLFNLISMNYSVTFSEMAKLDKGTYVKYGMKTETETFDLWANWGKEEKKNPLRPY